MLALVSCQPAAGTLTVDLVTDLVPGVEVFFARTTVTSNGAASQVQMTRLESGDDALLGVRVAEARALVAGTYAARVELLDATGARLVQRTIEVRMSGNYALRVVVARDCLSVSCPGATDPVDRTECLAGRCVVPSCVRPSECMSRECETNGDCPQPSAACASAECRDGVCFEVEVRGTCGDGLACDPDEGCVTIPDPPPEPELPEGGAPDHDGGMVTGDRDHDGFGADDCDDTNPLVFPGSPEDCGDGIDQDCSGADLPCPPDADGDGWDSGSDCNEADPTINPGAEENCTNAIDDDCDSVVDCPTGPDADGDGVSDALDCDDTNILAYPDALDVCGDGIDQDCDGEDTPTSQCPGHYLQPCGPRSYCRDTPRQYLACIDNQCVRCCALCANREAFHWVNVDHDCAAAAARYCDVGTRGGIEDDHPDPIQWGSCRR